MKIEIKNRFTREVLFEHERADNTVKLTVEAAVNAGANLYGASLEGASLEGANLYGASLDRARLVGANLYGASLEGASLEGARLDRARLDRARLNGASLDCARLNGASLVGASLVGASLVGASLDCASLVGAKNIMGSYAILAEIAARFDVSLKPVAAMIAGRLVGCWGDYTKTIREVFGDETINKLAEAWLQDEAWGVRDSLIEHGWIKGGKK